MLRKRSRVHTSYKTKYRVATWTEYDPARETAVRLGCSIVNPTLEMARLRSMAIVA